MKNVAGEHSKPEYAISIFEAFRDEPGATDLRVHF